MRAGDGLCRHSVAPNNALPSPPQPRCRPPATQVAEVAGLPGWVVARAAQVAAGLEQRAAAACGAIALAAAAAAVPGDGEGRRLPGGVGVCMGSGLGGAGERQSAGCGMADDEEDELGGWEGDW